MSRADIGAVIVNYRSGAETLRCISSLRQQGITEVTVVDNDIAESCKEDVVAAYPYVKVVVPGVNLGYGAAANRGVATLAASVNLVLVCNPDVEFGPGCVKALESALDRPPVAGRRAVIAGPLMRSPDGERYPSARRFPDPVTAGIHALLGLWSRDNRFSRRYRMEDGSLDGEGGTTVVDWVSGACFLVARDAFEALGGFDESYFMFVEDVDLCQRARAAGYAVVFEPSAEVLHAQGVSTSSRPLAMAIAHHRSAMLYAARTMTGWKRPLTPVAFGVLGVRAAGDVGKLAAVRIVRRGRRLGSRRGGGRGRRGEPAGVSGHPPGDRPAL